MADFQQICHPHILPKSPKKSTVKQDHLQTNRTVRDILAVSQQNRHNNLAGRDLLARLEHLYSFQAISLGSRSPSVPPLPPSPLSPRQSLSPFGKKRRISRSIDHSICHAALSSSFLQAEHYQAQAKKPSIRSDKSAPGKYLGVLTPMEKHCLATAA